MVLAIRAHAEIVSVYLGFPLPRRQSVAVLVAAVGLLLTACSGAQAPAPSSPAPVLTVVHPTATRMGEKFNVQPDGNSAIAVEGENLTRDMVIVFGETRLQTTYGSERELTAIVPSALFAQMGSYPISVRDGSQESNKLVFIVGP